METVAASPGRPVRFPQQIVVRVTARERAVLEYEAERLGLSLSRLVRTALDSFWGLDQDGGSHLT